MNATGGVNCTPGVAAAAGQRDYGPLIPNADRIVLSRVSGAGMHGGGEQGDRQEPGTAPFRMRSLPTGVRVVRGFRRFEKVERAIEFRDHHETSSSIPASKPLLLLGRRVYAPSLSVVRRWSTPHESNTRVMGCSSPSLQLAAKPTGKGKRAKDAANCHSSVCVFNIFDLDAALNEG